jgi:sugar phosphate isomerase/epimerase
LANVWASQTIGVGGIQLARLIDALPEAALGVDLHPSGLIAGGISPQEAVSEIGRHVIHVHACDAVSDPEAGRSAEVQLGRGMADFPALFGALAEFEYRGWVTIERRDAADPVADIENAVAYLRAL